MKVFDGSPQKIPQAGRHAATPCLLSRLTDPRLTGVIPGLKLEDHCFVLDPKVWGCCGGSGFQAKNLENSPADSMVSCRLRHRLRVIQEIYERFLLTYPERSFPLTVSPVQAAACYDRFWLIAARKSHAGICVLSAHGTDQEVSIWSLALAASWRYGLHVHVIDLEKTEPKDVLPRPSSHKASSLSPDIVMVEGVQRLWDTALADRLELLVHYCYNGLLPLFLGIQKDRNAPAHDPSPRGSLHLQSAFHQRIAKARARKMGATLSPECAGKLRATTSGIESWLSAIS